MKRNLILPIMLMVVAVTCGCAMFTSWRSIPPPGGCDQCHTVPISNDWQVTYRAPHLTDERSRREYFQTAESTMPQDSKPLTSLDTRKVEELPCFDCHRSPNAKHRERTGRFHH